MLVAKYADHQPLYRQEGIYARSGVQLPRSTLAAWVGACGVQLQPLVDALKAEMLSHRVLHTDETPVAMLDPGAGKTHRAYLWSYCTCQFEDSRIFVYDFAESRAGKHAMECMGDWRGALVCDDYSGYKALLAKGMTEVGCMAHARRKFFELWANHRSQIAEQALSHFGKLYDVEREVQASAPEQRLQARQSQAKPVTDALHLWLTLHRQKVPDGSATAKAIDYSLKRWAALTRYLDDAMLPIDNNWVENRIRPVALGRSNWLFAGSLRAGKRAAAVMSLIQSAKLNGLEPWAYLKDVLTRLPTQPASRIAELLPHRWAQPTWLEARSASHDDLAGRILTSQLVADALMMAVWRRGRPLALLHHSDQGSQYTSEHFQGLLKEQDITCSMNRAGQVWDNSAMESFFGSLKTARTAAKAYRTREQIRADVFDYIERFYNPTRRHSTLGYVSPIQFEEARKA